MDETSSLANNFASINESLSLMPVSNSFQNGCRCCNGELILTSVIGLRRGLQSSVKLEGLRKRMEKFCFAVSSSLLYVHESRKYRASKLCSDRFDDTLGNHPFAAPCLLVSLNSLPAYRGSTPRAPDRQILDMHRLSAWLIA